MQLVIGPVLTRETGYAFDTWSPEDGLRRGYVYRRVEDACYARNFEIRTHDAGPYKHRIACGTLDHFVRSTTEASRLN